MLQYNFSEIVILADRENKKEAKKKISKLKLCWITMLVLNQ